MDILIVICLLVVIALLGHDKVVIHKRKEQKPTKEKSTIDLPDIMGQPKQVKSLLEPNDTREDHKEEPKQENNNFDIEIDEEEVDIQIPQGELDDVFKNMPDFEEEEEEWDEYRISVGDDGFAQGVTFEELSSVGMLLQKDKLEPSQKETAVAIVQKMQGTELFSLLENSMESASRKIAELLDGTLSSETDAGSSTLRKNDVDDFDIREFT